MTKSSRRSSRSLDPRTATVDPFAFPTREYPNTMFNNPVPLNSENHRHLCYVRGRGYGFARALLSTPVVAGEASQIAREYVLVFSRDVERPPQAVLATEEGVNAHITGSDQARWLGRYVPAHLRRYPFVAVAAGTGEDGEQNLTLAVDWDAPNVSWHEGERLFTDGGEPTALLQQLQSGLNALQSDIARTQRLVHQLDEAGLLSEQPLRVQPRGGEPKTLKGFRVVDRTRYAALDGDTLTALRDSGALALVHAHFISLTNLEDGVLAQQPARTAEAARFDFDEPDNISFDLLR